MAFVLWGLPIQRVDDTAALVPAVGHGTHVRVFDAGDIPIDLPVTPGVGGQPPTLRVYQADDTPVDLLLAPSDIGLDVQDSPATNLEANSAVTPDTVKAEAAVVGRILIAGRRFTSYALSDAPATCLAPVIAHGTLPLPMPVVAAAAGAIATSPAASFTGNLEPDTVAASSSPIQPRPEHGAIAKAAGLQSSTAETLTPAQVGASTLNPSTQAALASALPAHIAITQAHAIATSDAPSSALAPARAMGTAKRTPDLNASTAAVLAPAAVATGGPPTFPIVTNAPAEPLAPTRSGTGSRAAELETSSSSALEPELTRGALERAAALHASNALVLAPAITHAGAIAPDLLSSSASQPSLEKVGMLLRPANLASEASPSTPAIAGTGAIAPAVHASNASPITPSVDSPWQHSEPDMASAIAAVLEPFARRFEALVLTPATATSTAAARRATPVEDLQPADVVLEAVIEDHVDYTQEHGTMLTVQQSTAGIKIDMPMRNSAGGPLDLEGATQVYMWLRPPSGTPKRRSAMVLGETTLGIVRYLTGPADFHEHGVWGVQVGLVLANGEPAWSSVRDLRVVPNIGPYGPQSSSPHATATAGALQPSIVFS